MEITDIDQLFTKTDKLNSAIIRREWFKDTHLAKRIFAFTSFLPEETSILKRIHFFKHELKEHPKCKFCNAPAHFNPFASKLGIFLDICNSKSCSAKNCTAKRLITMNERYGSNVSKNHNSNKESANRNFIEKGLLTRTENKKRDSSLKKKIANKSKNTLLARYGVDHPAKIKSVRNAAIEKSLNYFQNLSDRVTVLNFEQPIHTNKLISFQCKECAQSDCIPTETFKWRIKNTGTGCRSCSGISMGSLFQSDVHDFIKSIYNGKIEINNRKMLEGSEIDIYLPEKKLGIECNGIFWHSTNSINEDNEYKNYHFNKTQIAYENGINLFHVFEDEWMFKKDIIKQKLKRLVSEKLKLENFTIFSPLNDYVTQFFIDNKLEKLKPFKCALVLKMDSASILMTFNDDKISQICMNSDKEIKGGIDFLVSQYMKQHDFKTLTYVHDRTHGNFLNENFILTSNLGLRYRWIDLKKPNHFHCYSELNEEFKNGLRKLWNAGLNTYLYQVSSLELVT